LRIIVISLLEEPDILWPYYQQGYLKGIPEGHDPTEFCILILAMMRIQRFHMIHYNNELIGYIEDRPFLPTSTDNAKLFVTFKDGDRLSIIHECHAVWFTENKVKISLALQKFLTENEGKNLITFVNKDKSSGFFALQRRGRIEYSGEYNDMQVFKHE